MGARISTDYLVVGAGAAGLAFADTLVAEADVEVILVDRRDGPGGHWLDAYPFVRLHTPSAYYGVTSLALGEDRVDESGENAGFYERATGREVCAHFAQAAERLVATGRVTLLLGHEHVGTSHDAERVSELSTGVVRDIAVRRRVVDARYLEASIPATHTPPFAVDSDVRLVPLNDLPVAAGSADSYTVLGSGKTAADACLWLIEDGVDPDRIRWVRPRDAWFYDRVHFQPLDQVGALMEGISLDAEAAAQATSLADLFDRLEASGRLVRIDPSAPATMFRGTMLSANELRTLRQIADVVRLGHVRRIERDRMVLERGECDTGADVLHVDCTAAGLSPAPAQPLFGPGRIVLQQVRHLSPSFNAALVAFLEAHREDDEERNRLCPPNPYPSAVEDWPAMNGTTWQAEATWTQEPDLVAWVMATRLNLLRALPHHLGEPQTQAAVQRYVGHVGPALERLGELA